MVITIIFFKGNRLWLVRKTAASFATASRQAIFSLLFNCSHWIDNKNGTKCFQNSPGVFKDAVMRCYCLVFSCPWSLHVCVGMGLLFFGHDVGWHWPQHVGGEAEPKALADQGPGCFSRWWGATVITLLDSPVSLSQILIRILLLRPAFTLVTVFCFIVPFCCFVATVPGLHFVGNLSRFEVVLERDRQISYLSQQQGWRPKEWDTCRSEPWGWADICRVTPHHDYLSHSVSQVLWSQIKYYAFFFSEYKQAFFNAFITPVSFTTDKIPQKQEAPDHLQGGSRSFAGSITEGLFARK